MGSLLHRPALLHDDDQVGIAHRGKPMGDHDRGAALAQPAERDLDGCLALGVERAGRFIEQQDARIAQQGARQSDALALAAGQPLAARADPGGIAVGQRGDETRRRRPHAAAVSISASTASGRPMRILAATVSSNSSVSCAT